MSDTFLTEINTVVDRLKQPHTAAQACEAVQQAAQALVGHRLFTVLYVAQGAQEVARIYSSNPQAYPVAGRKRMGPTPWGARVITGRQAYVGHNADDIRWAFPDHELIASLGLASVINIAICHQGACVGTLNLLDAAGSYRDDQVALLEPLGALLVPLLVAAAGQEPVA